MSNIDVSDRLAFTEGVLIIVCQAIIDGDCNPDEVADLIGMIKANRRQAIPSVNAEIASIKAELASLKAEQEKPEQPEPKPTKDTYRWEFIDPKYRWGARDEDGRVWLYGVRPTCRRTGSYWIDAPASAVVGVPKHIIGIHTPGTCDWRDSLVERPEGE